MGVTKISSCCGCGLRPQTVAFPFFHDGWKKNVIVLQGLVSSLVIDVESNRKLVHIPGSVLIALDAEPMHSVGKCLFHASP